MANPKKTLQCNIVANNHDQVTPFDGPTKAKLLILQIQYNTPYKLDILLLLQICLSSGALRFGLTESEKSPLEKGSIPLLTRKELLA